jgi:hypothetical protein
MPNEKVEDAGGNSSPLNGRWRASGGQNPAGTAITKSLIYCTRVLNICALIRQVAFFSDLIKSLVFSQQAQAKRVAFSGTWPALHLRYSWI